MMGMRVCMLVVCEGVADFGLGWVGVLEFEA